MNEEDDQFEMESLHGLWDGFSYIHLYFKGFYFCVLRTDRGMVLLAGTLRPQQLHQLLQLNHQVLPSLLNN